MEKAQLKLSKISEAELMKNDELNHSDANAENILEKINEKKEEENSDSDLD